MIPFLDCNIWEVKQWPKIGDNLEYHTLNDIYHYNSLNCLYEDKQQSAYIQIPETLIGNIEEKQIILDNLDYIVLGEIPVMRKITDENWVIDLKYFKR
jgi:hypothetical protein